MGTRHTSGANASLEQTWAVIGTSVRIVGGKNAPSALPPRSSLPPIATASSTQRCVRPAAVPSTIGPRSVVGVERVADLERSGAGDERVHELIPDVLVDEHPLDADAHLAGIRERTDEAALDRPLDVRASCRR